jgi:Domain of unknown function (DUF1772)
VCWSILAPGIDVGSAVLILANWPYTLGVVFPVNKRLEATPPASANAETRGLVETWGKLHAVRSALGLGTTLIYLWATVCAENFVRLIC